MAECMTCQRVIRRGRTCSAVACVAKAQAMERRDYQADRQNPRHPLYAGDEGQRLNSVDTD